MYHAGFAQELQQAQEDCREAQGELRTLHKQHSAAGEEAQQALRRVEAAEAQLAAAEAARKQASSEAAALRRHLASQVETAAEERRKSGERLAAGARHSHPSQLHLPSCMLAVLRVPIISPARPWPLLATCMPCGRHGAGFAGPC